MAKAKAASREASPEAAISPEESASPSASSTPTARKTVKLSSVTKPRLTAHQKNTNHKDAENKRRNAIREQFTELASLVPGAEGLERISARRRLVQELQAKGLTVGQDLILGEDQYQGSKWKTPNIDEFERSKRKRIAKEGANAPNSNDGDEVESMLV